MTKPLSAAMSVLSLALLLPSTALAACPDGTWDEGEEECDDGNATPGDGCSAECQAECSEVGGGATEHTCLHGGFGPFVTQPAQVYPGFIYSDVSTPHTYFTLTLTGKPGEDHNGALFFPAADGDFAIYMKTQFPLVLRDSAGAPVPVFLEHAITSCSVADSLTWVKTYKDLKVTEEYTLDIGPTAEATVSFALEYLPGFGNFWFRDADQDNHGGQLVGQSWCTSPEAYVPHGEDCDDDNADVNPEATELCNGVDDNCDTAADVDTEGLCETAVTGSVCLDTGASVACGCSTSADCGSELTCDTTTHQCEAPSTGEGGTGAGTGAGGEAGGAQAGAGGEPGDDEASAGAGGDQGVVAGGAGRGGKTGSGGSSKAGSATGGKAGHGGTAPTSPNDEGDSGCQLGGAPSSSGWLWLAATAATLLRRRRHGAN